MAPEWSQHRLWSQPDSGPDPHPSLLCGLGQECPLSVPSFLCVEMEGTRVLPPRPSGDSSSGPCGRCSAWAWLSAALGQGTVKLISDGSWVPPMITRPSCVCPSPPTSPHTTGSLPGAPHPTPKPAQVRRSRACGAPSLGPQEQDGWREQGFNRCSLTRIPWLCLIKIVKY